MGDTLETKIAALRVHADLLELQARKGDIFTIDYTSNRPNEFTIQGKLNNFKYSYELDKDNLSCVISSYQDVVKIHIKEDIPRRISWIIMNGKTLNTTTECEGHDAMYRSLQTLYDCVSAGNDISIPQSVTPEEGGTPRSIPHREEEKLLTLQWSWNILRRVETHLHEVIPEFFQIIDNYKSGNYSPNIVSTPVQLRGKEDVMKSFDLS